MRTAVLHCHDDKVHCPVAEARVLACGVAVSMLTAAFNFVQVIYPPRLLTA